MCPAKDFLSSLTVSHAKTALRAGRSVLDASLDAGLSGPGRLPDLCVTLEAASPGEIKTGGEGWTIRAAVVESPFGLCLAGECPRGICHVSFVESTDHASLEKLLLEDWPHADIDWDTSLVSYGQLAESLGDRSAARAVGLAVGKNRLGYLIPCYRVIRETGVVSDDRWGPFRKHAMLARELRNQKSGSGSPSQI